MFHTTFPDSGENRHLGTSDIYSEPSLGPLPTVPGLASRAWTDERRGYLVPFDLARQHISRWSPLEARAQPTSELVVRDCRVGSCPSHRFPLSLRDSAEIDEPRLVQRRLNRCVGRRRRTPRYTPDGVSIQSPQIYCYFFIIVTARCDRKMASGGGLHDPMAATIILIFYIL